MLMISGLRTLNCELRTNSKLQTVNCVTAQFIRKIAQVIFQFIHPVIIHIFFRPIQG